MMKRMLSSWCLPLGGAGMRGLSDPHSWRAKAGVGGTSPLRTHRHWNPFVFRRVTIPAPPAAARRATRVYAPQHDQFASP